MSNIKSLEEALKECLSDDDKISKYEARVIREMVLADGKITEDEKRVLHHALENDKFDEEGFRILSETLMRADMK